MAYQFTDYSGYGDESDFETRKRRAMMLAGLPEGAGLADMAGQAINNRIGQAQDTITQAGQMVSNPEEELKKRMGVAQPVAPEVVQQQVPQQLPAQGPISPEMAQQPVAQTQLPQPGPAVQVAGPAQLPAQPVAEVQPQAVATPVPQVNQQLIDARNETDPAKRRNMFAQIMAKEDVTPGDKAIAERLFAEDYMKERKIAEAEKKIQEATPNDLSRYMREKTKEGSYVKAILYARLGLNDLAQKEQELLSPTLKMSSAIDSKGQQYTVERDKDGAIVRGFDNTGKTVSQEVLANLSAAAMPTQAHLLPSVHGTPVQRTNENGQVETGLMMYDPRTQQSYVQVGQNRMPTTGWTTMSQTPQSVYGARGAGVLGEQAAKTGTQQPALPPMAGTPQVQQPVAQPTAQPQVQQPAQQVQTPQAQSTPQVQATASPTGGVKLTPQRTAGGGTVVQQQPGESYEAYQQRKKAAEEQTQANIQASKELRVAEAKPPAEARGKVEAKDVTNQAMADSTYSLIKPISDLIKKSTGSGIGAGVDVLASKLGATPAGQEAISELEVLSAPILANVPRFEGAQSDYDVKMYQKFAGDFANPEKTTKARLAALNGLITIMKKYDKAGTNDWSFGGTKEQVVGRENKPAGQSSGTTSSGNKYKRVQ